ncbi:protein adenylyltransferase SelO family protein [Rothia sp. ZJ1223]|uniref:protein adenylyltransferase SelO family protein n=1 Tax=Rothia sp. ZJ1223 TaxID=2811098 RepID=UPI00195E7CE7|nr:protein adenylyltransferase SelO family protein [Rothia sp. ZJ1223]MBM7052297.1 YdiU family protein [Rothia sp. ZJ1223]
MTPTLENTYVQSFPQLAVQATPDIPEGSRVTWVNDDLAQELGLDSDWLATEGMAWLTGTSAENPTPHALAYSGFQFGQLSPVLGDGRAHLVGELSRASAPGEREKQNRVDIHLKGSGLTPFSRPGSDGKAPLSAVWREVVIGESLHALGVPTSRALAVIETGEKIRRRSPLPEPAGIVVRVSSSHLRVGTFQFAQYNCDTETRNRLVEYALHRHYPHLAVGEAPENALTLLRQVVEEQAKLVAHWMGLGFVHGVLNTDNVSISGQSIDFGPCAFIDGFSRDAVYSSIDQQGRYKYRNQPGITHWNLARFAETLLDLIDPNGPNRAIERAKRVLDEFEDAYAHAHTLAFAAKLGLDMGPDAPAYLFDEIAAFIEGTLDLMERFSLDFTGFFRSLTDGENPFAEHPSDLSVTAWQKELTELRVETKTSDARAHDLMHASNPVYMPRNLVLEETLRAVEAGNSEPVEQLLAAVRAPYTRVLQQDLTGAHAQLVADLEKAEPSARFFRSFCGT